MIELTLAYKEHLFNQNNLRKSEQEKQYAYYSGNLDKLKKYLTKALELTYDSADVPEMQFQFINLTKKIINQLSIVYSKPPKRYLVKEDSTVDEDWTKFFNREVLPENLNKVDKKYHRLGKLSGSSLTYIKFDKSKKRIEYIVNPIHYYDIEWDDEGNIKRVMYPKYLKNDNDEDEFYIVVWEKNSHYLFDELGNKKQIGDNKEKVNPYGRPPFVFSVLNEGESPFGEGENDLINVNEQINLLLTKLVSSDVIMGSEGTLLAINLGLIKKGEEDGGVKKIRAHNRKHPIAVETKPGDTVPPSLEHITTNPMINEIRDLIDWYIIRIAAMKGLSNPSSLTTQLSDTSDYQKLMDSLDQMEMRKDDIETLRIFERERFDLTREIWNIHAEEFGLKKIPEDLKLKIDFSEIITIKTPEDERADFEFQLKYNLTTPVKYLMEKNPDLTEEMANEQIEKNKQENNKQSVKSRLQTLINASQGQSQSGQPT